MDEAEARAVRVTIFGEEYSIRSEMGEEYTLACAKHVDDAIQDAHVRGHVPEPHKAVILAALQITDELFRGKAAHSAGTRMVLNRLSALRQRVDAALEEAGSGLRTGG
jgi:cell division protein ZapA